MQLYQVCCAFSAPSLPCLMHSEFPVCTLLYGHITPHQMTLENEAVDQPKGVKNPMIMLRCWDVIEQYHVGQIWKGDTIYEFMKTIPVGETETMESPSKTLESYILILDNWDHKRTLSDINEHERGGCCESRPNSANKRCEQPDTGGGYNINNNCNEPVHKWPKIDPELFPWVISDKVEGSSLQDKCITTRNLIANYTINVKLAKVHLLNVMNIYFPLLFPFDYTIIHVLITWSLLSHHPLHSPYHSDFPPYLCLSYSDLISLSSQIIFLIVLCFYLLSHHHNLLSIWLSLHFLHSILLFYILLSSYWMFHSTYFLALSLIVLPMKFQAFLMFLLVDSST
jgi:hypothetical protein